MIQVQTLFDDGDQHVSGDSSPYLRLDRVFGCPKEGLDTQMLFDPFEEQLDLPALFVKCANSQRRKRHVVRQELQCLASFGIGVGHLPNQLWIPFVRCVSRQLNVLIAYQARVDGDRKFLNHNELHIAFGAGHKEGSGGMQLVQPGKVDIRLVHHVIGANLDVALLCEDVEDFDIVHLAVADVNKTRNRSTQIHQCVKFDGCFCRTKRRPRKQTQTQIDRGRIQRVNGCAHQRFEIGTRCVVGVKRTSHADQMMRQIGKDFPWPNAVRVGQGVARDRLAAKTQVIEMLALHTQIDLDIAQRLARGQLSKRQSQELIETREVFDFVLRAPGQDHPAECLQRQISHDLRKDELTRVHACPQQIRSAKHAPSPENDSNRGQRENQIYSNKSLGYVWSVGKRWDTSEVETFNFSVELGPFLPVHEYRCGSRCCQASTWRHRTNGQ